MSSTNQEVLNEFVSESREHLGTVAEELLALEKASGADRRERLDRLFRAMHSVKGAASLVGCRQIADLAHSLETIFDRVRQGALAQTANLTDGLLTGADLIRALLDDAANSNEADVAGAIARLESLLAGPPAPHAEVASTHAIQVDLDAYVRRTDRSLGRFFADLETSGVVREPRLLLPEHDISKGLPGGPVRYECQYTSAVPLEQLAEQLRLQLAEFSAAAPEPAEPEPAEPEPAEPEPEGSAAEGADPPVVARTESAGRPEAERPSSVRISVQILDRLMNLAGELVLVRNQALQAADPADSQMRQIVQRLNGVTTDVQQVVMLTRMQPVGNLFGKFPRLVRDLSRKLGKQIEFTTRGTEVELDKAILEALADPLTHLVRNCCDHGIEKPAERIAAGKVPQGHILLHAHHEGGQIRIEVRDDGRGIDPQRVRRKALERGLKSAAELAVLSDTELQALILLPGFSTADDVTELSGRGVGMDVVRTNIEHLGGNLQIESAPGSGTCMHLRLPLTLAIIPCLTVMVGDQRYAIAQKDLEELVCLSGQDGTGTVEHTHDQEVYRLRGRLLPLVRLGEVLARPKPFTAATRAEILHRHRAPGLTYIAVVKVGSERFGLVVDRLLNTEEIVVKSIHPILKPLRCYSGSTIMGDGRAVLILDIEGIARHAGISFENARQTRTVRGSGETEAQTVLLFQYGPREQFAIPVVMIRRIEEIRVARIERVGDREFWNLHGQAIRVLRLDNYLKVSPPTESETMYLLLPKNVRQPMGILLSRILDTQSLSIQIDTESHHQDGLMGTAIIRDRMTLFPHLYRLGERLEAEDLAASETRTRKAPSRRKRVLLVEDTQFFRQVVKSTLEDEGYEVFTAVNGALGLREISQNQYDLVVSDINMPEMDGWDMARAVREQLGNHELPMLALTTLSSDRDRNRALESGFNAHEVKLSRESFLATVARLLAASAEGKHG